MMHPSEPDAQPQSALWMLDLGQLLPVGPVLQGLSPVDFLDNGDATSRRGGGGRDVGLGPLWPIHFN